jgi:cytochrome c biogenesis protein CcmG, thiol:disulfide interchange protein DsbE
VQRQIFATAENAEATQRQDSALDNSIHGFHSSDDVANAVPVTRKIQKSDGFSRKNAIFVGLWGKWHFSIRDHFGFTVDSLQSRLVWFAVAPGQISVASELWHWHIRPMKNHLLPLVASLAIFLTTSSLRAAAPTLEGSRVREQLNEMQGQPAPKLALKGWINAEPMTLKKLKGKIVVLDFWATWCGPCLASIPHTNELMEKYADQGVVIIGVCAKRGAEKMADTVKQRGIKYPVAEDTGTIASYKANSYPDYYIIDRNGALRWADIANRDVEKAIKILLEEKDKAE